MSVFLLILTPLWVSAIDSSSLIYPQPRWEKAFDVAEDVGYGVAPLPDGGAVVVGTSGVVAYDIAGNLLWKADYPGTAYSVAVDTRGTVYVAGDAGLFAFDPTGKDLWKVKGDFRCVSVLDGTILVTAKEKLIGLGPEGKELWSFSFSAGLVAAAAQGTGIAVGTSLEAMMLDPQSRKIRWSAPSPGELRDLVLDPEGNLYVVGAEGIRAYGPQGMLLWETDFPGRAAAGTLYTGPEGPWLVVVGTQGNGIVLAGYSPTDGELFWKLLDPKSKGSVQVNDAAALGRVAVFYVAGANLEKGPEDPDYLTKQYVLSSPPGESPLEGCSLVADFTFSPARPLSGEEVAFRNLSGEGATAWVWDFGDGASSREWNPSHVYPGPGTYTVTLTVIDAIGCKDTVQKLVEVGNRPPEAVSVDYEIAPRAAFSWSVEREAHGKYPEGFRPSGPTDLDDLLFCDESGAGAVTLRAKARDPDGTVVAYKWDLDFDGVPDAEGQEVTWDFGKPGVYPITLLVADDRGAEAHYEGFVDTQNYEVVTWKWDFGDGATSEEENPTHWYQDDGVYRVTLTVYDARRNSDSITKEITVLNVPPVADFTWSFEQPPGFLPTCDDLIGEGPPMPMSIGESEGFGIACQEPEIPANAGVVVLSDESKDSEPWGEITGRHWSWNAEGGYGECRSGDCESGANPELIFLRSTPYGDFLYRGDVEVALEVQDDDGAISRVTKTITIANIPPYAAFAWEGWGSWSPLNCSSCANAYGNGDPEKSGSVNGIAVTRRIHSWECGSGELGTSAILAPWSGAGVELYLEGSGTVEVTETIPEGWSYWLPTWNLPNCVTNVTEGDNSWSATVNLDACGGSVLIWYDLYPPDPWSGSPAQPGTYTISGRFISASSQLTLDSTVVVCDRVDVEVTVHFRGLGWDELRMADPNGDEIASYVWNFGEFGSASGQDLTYYFFFENLVCTFDPGRGWWFWSYDLPVSLTVTDEAGGSTTVETTIHLEGPCGGGEAVAAR